MNQKNFFGTEAASIMILSTTTVCVNTKGLIATISITETDKRNSEFGLIWTASITTLVSSQCYAERHIFIIMLSVIMLSIIMPSVIMLNVIVPRFIFLKKFYNLILLFLILIWHHPPQWCKTF